jgi:ABC-2 type transport system permease protein
VRSLRRVLAIARKEIRQLRRDRLTFGMIAGIPVVQLLLFGYAINQDVRDLRAGVVDLAASSSSRRLVAEVEASQVLDVVARVASVAELEDLMRRGEISVGVVVPHDFERRVLRGPRPPAQLLVDSSDPLNLAAARGLLDLPVGRRSGSRPELRSDAVSTATFALRPYYNPERRTEVHIVPGLIGVILTMTMVLFTAVAIVRERERGNLELLITTPVRTPELMAGKLVPYAAIGLVQTTLVLFVGRGLFAVPLRGALFDLYLGALVFICAALSLGLLISTAAATQFQAFQLTFFTFLPQILLSGFMFPFDAMPRAARWIGEVLPLTHFLRVVRGILLRGAGIHELASDLWPLGLFAAVTLALTLLRFRKRLD